MQNSPTDGGASECIGGFLDEAVDLTVRFLADRAELSPSAAYAVNRVCREGPIRLTALAAKEGISQPSMTQLVQRLERQDLVTRLADPDDGRAALIGITEHGQEVLDARRQVRRERLGELLATLTPEEESALWLAARVAFPLLVRLAAEADGSPEGEPATSGRHSDG